MRKLFKILFLFGIVVLTAFSCEDEDFNPSIIGKWEWLGTVQDPGSIYPSEDYQIMIEFTKDSIYKKYINNELDHEGRFWTFDGNILEYEQPLEVDPNYRHQEEYEIRKDKLIYLDRGGDWLEYESYKRIK